jgi:hypothetical protein
MQAVSMRLSIVSAKPRYSTNLAVVVGQSLALEGSLYAAVVHPENDGIGPVFDDALHIDMSVHNITTSRKKSCEYLPRRI